MKTKKQYKDSMMNFIIGGIGVTLIVILVLVLNSTEPQHQPNIDKYEWNQGECGDTSTLQDSLELIEFDTIYYDTLIYNMLDITNINKETKVWTGTTQGVDTSYPDDYGNKKQK